MSKQAFAAIFESLGDDSLANLYSCPWTCQAAFQVLSPLAQQFVVRMLVLPSNVKVHMDFFAAWMKADPSSQDDTATTTATSTTAQPASTTRSDTALSELESMRMLVVHTTGPAVGPQAAVLGRVDKTTVVDVSATPRRPAVALVPSFRESLLDAFSRLDRQPWRPRSKESTKPGSKRERPGVSASHMEREAHSNWERVLHFMVGSKASSRPSSRVIRVLEDTGLVVVHSVEDGADATSSGGAGGGAGAGAGAAAASVKAEDGAADGDGDGDGDAATRQKRREYISITRKGYAFMLKDTAVQMWTFMLQYIQSSAKRSLDPREVVQFLFKLSFCTVSTAYPVSALSPSQVRLLAELSEFGLLYQAADDHEWFYATSLATSLTFASSDTKPTKAQLNLSWESVGGKASMGTGARKAGVLSASSEVQRHSMQVVVEKNFKVYVYTMSELSVALISMFLDVEYQLPNLVAGMLTRESVQKALSNGVSAQQMIDFLSKHAHPCRVANPPLIPDNVLEQLILWERERKRVRFDKATKLSDFDNREQYERVRDWATARNMVLLAVDKSKTMVIRAKYFNECKAFIKAHR